VRASDGKGGSSSADFSFFVLPENHLPEWIVNPLVAKFREGDDIRFDLAPWLRESDGDALTFSVVQTAGWGTLSAAGVFTGKAEPRLVGRHTFQFRAADTQGGAAIVVVKIDIESVNHAPTWAQPRLPEATEGTIYQSSLGSFASDPDGDALVFHKVGAAPAWLTLTASGSLSGTPDALDTGANTVRVRATDKHGEFAETQFTVQVNPVNHPPRWRQTAPIYLGEALEGTPFRFNLAAYATDPDADALVFESVSGPKWMIVAANGQVSGTPARADAGPFQAVLRVRDGSRWIDTAAQGAVRSRNQPPVVKLDWPVFQVKERETLQGALNQAVHVVDADGDPLTFYLKSTVPWVKLSTDGKFTLAPTAADRGTHAFAISIDDGRDSIIGALRVEVLANARPPVWHLDPITRLAMANEVFSGSVASHAQEMDGRTLGFFKKSGKRWLAVAADGSVEGVPTDADLGVNTFTVSACNADKQCADTVLNVDVQKGLAGDRWKLADRVAGAKADVLWVLDPSTTSKPVVSAVQAALGDFKAAMTAAGVTAQCTTLDATYGEHPPDGVQSPLWALYGSLTPATPAWRLTATVTEAMVVTRQRDGLRWFADRLVDHRGVGADAYWNTLLRAQEKKARALRVSAIAPSCPALGAVGGSALAEATYRQWTEKTGGLYFDGGCKLATKAWMQQYADKVALLSHATAKQRLALTRVPQDSAYIDVTIGGVSVKRGAGWTYDAATNAVHLDWSRIDTRTLTEKDWIQTSYPATGTR
jgi:hypothetical protein